MANDKDFKVKNGVKPTRYVEGLGTVVSGTENYYLTGAAYDSASFSVASQSSYTFDFSFADSGTKLYAQKQFNGGTIYQYTLSSAYDLSTASYANKSYSFANGESGFVITPDGSTLYISANTGDAVYRYTFGTAFDVSTLGSGTSMFSTSSVDTQPDKCKFNSNGTKFFLLGRNNKRIYEYAVSTAYDLSSASYSNNSLLLSGQAAAPLGFNFNSDGTKLFVSDNTTDKIFQYNLSTAYDITSASYSNLSFSVAGQDATPSGIDFNSTGSKLFILGNSSNTVYQYSTVLSTDTLDLSTGSVFNYTPTASKTLKIGSPAASGTNSGATLLVNGSDAAGITGNFSTTLYTGTGSSLAINNGINLASDGGLVWTKRRSSANSNWFLDSVRGGNQILRSNTTEAQFTSSGFEITSFNSNGYTLGTASDINSSSQNDVSWTFKSTPNFFDIVTYTGNGNDDHTISHNLGTNIGTIMIKCTSHQSNWVTWHRTFTQSGSTSQFIYLNKNSALTSDTNIFNGFSTTNFTVGGNGAGGSDAYTHVNSSGRTYVAYLFAHDTSSGPIQCGSYTGNASTDGPTINLGWQPQWIMIKNTSSSTTNWIMFDDKRGISASGNDALLNANKTTAENNLNNFLSVTSTGFKLGTTGYGASDTSGDNYIYVAIRAADVVSTTYDSSIKFSGGTAPASPAVGETDVITLDTTDGGTNYYASLAIDGAK